MALVSLSPWPTEDADVTAAIACLKTVLPGNLTDDRIERLGQMAADRVERYAPNAPANTKSVAVELFCGYAAQINTGPIAKLNVGKLDLERRTNHSAVWNHCGAAGLLSEWKTRNGMIISGTSNDDDETEDTDMPRTQLAAIPLGETPVNLSSGLDDGDYQFQRSVTSDPEAIILYYFGDTASADEADYFTLGETEFVDFTVPGNVWARVLDTLTDREAAVAISTA